MTSLNNMINQLKNILFNFQTRVLILFFIGLRLLNFSAQKNDDLFLFIPSDIKIPILKDKNIFNPPMELKIAKEDIEVLHSLFQKKFTEYSFIDSELNSNKLKSKGSIN